MVLFEIKNLTFTYPEAPKSAISDVSFSVESGEFIVICGKSGSGKTTLARHFKTVLTPYGKREGDIFYCGKRLEEVPARAQAAQIGYVLQNPESQIVTAKVWHELAFGLENLGYDRQAILLRVAETASFFGIQNWFEEDVNKLSEGQKQVLNLACVMAMHPAALILDEPTAHLDPIAAQRFFSVIRKINLDIGTTVIMIEQRLEEALPMADKVLVLNAGRVSFYDSPKKAGRALEGSDLFIAMPSPVRIYYGTGQTGDAPITVRDGRRWLEGTYEKNSPDEKGFALGKRAEDVKKREDYAIEAKDLYFRYDRDSRDVIRGLSLKVRKGSLFCILGGNGTGKSTALSLICGVRKPYRGKIYLAGRDIRKISGRDMFDGFLGMLPQDPRTLFVKDSVLEDLREMISELPHAARKEREGLLNKVVEDMQLSRLLDMHPYDLSAGEQQRAALAKVLLLRPKILLLDEPAKGLDGFYKSSLGDIFKRLTASGTTILMVSHDVEFCAQYADECALFFDGALAYSGDTKEFFTGNSFYTTAANRMARNVFPTAVTVKDVIEQCQTGRLRV